MTRLDDPAVVRMEYAHEAGLAARQSIWSAATGGDVHGLVVQAVGAGHVLEVGCGRGELAERLVRELGVDLIALDQSERMVELTRARGIDTRVGDVQDLPFRDDAFDCAVAAWMLYHVPDVGLALTELARVLRRGGRLVAVTNSNENLRELRTLVGWTSDYSFGAENGESLLLDRFSHVQRIAVRGTVTFPDRRSAVDYLEASILAKHLAQQLPVGDWPLVSTRSLTVFVATK